MIIKFLQNQQQNIQKSKIQQTIPVNQDFVEYNIKYTNNFTTTQQFRNILHMTGVQLPEIKTEEQIKDFFNKSIYKDFNYISYQEFVELYGVNVHPERLVDMNKYHVKTHLNYFNFCYNQSYEYRWYPVYAMFLFNSLRFRSTSFIGTFTYLFLFDYYFENYFLNKHKKKKIIKINQAFDYRLIKPQYIQQRQEQINKLISIIQNREHPRLTDDDKRWIERNEIIFGKKQDLDKEFEMFINDGDDSDEYKVPENNFIKTVSHFINDFWYHYIDHPNSSENIKQKVKEVTSADNFEKIKKETKEFQKEFVEYKEDLGFFPNRQDCQVLTKYKEINQNKVYNMKQLVRDQLETSFETVNYLFTGQSKKVEIPLKYFYFGEFDKEIRPKYRIDSFLPQLVTFTLFCIIPAKLLFKSGSFFKTLALARKRQKILNKKK